MSFLMCIVVLPTCMSVRNMYVMPTEARRKHACYRTHVDVRGHLAGIGFLLSLCGSWGLNSGFSGLSGQDHSHEWLRQVKETGRKTQDLEVKGQGRDRKYLHLRD